MKFKRIAAIAALCVAGVASAQTQWTTQSGGNGHYYLFVGDAVTAQDAFAGAAARTYLGVQGYLATVTSAEENSFVSLTIANGAQAWLGGSDAGDTVNAWTWRVGPEAGQAFTYTNWSGGEPNNCCTGEDYLHTNWTGGGGWNDHGAPGNPGHVNGYVVEFSAAPVPEPATYALMLAGLAAVGARAARRSPARRS